MISFESIYPSMNKAHTLTESRDASQPNRTPCSELYSDRIIIMTGAGLNWCAGNRIRRRRLTVVCWCVVGMDMDVQSKGTVEIRT
jgi:hypothetical protein